MKKYLLMISILLALTSCEAFNDLEGTKEITPISVEVALDFNIDNLAELKDLKVKFDNYDEDMHYEKEVIHHTIEMNDILPGIYTVNVSGTALDHEGNEYFVNGSVVNQGIFQEGSSLKLNVKGQKISPLVFKEIYYACSKTPLNKSYIYDQFYEVYNNSSSVLYLDGIHFANLYPDKSSTSLPCGRKKTVRIMSTPSVYGSFQEKGKTILYNRENRVSSTSLPPITSWLSIIPTRP